MLTIENLEKELQLKNLGSLYLLYGEEVFLLESALGKIKKIFGHCEKGINYITLDETNINKLIPNIETPAFGYEKKLIVAKNTGLFKKAAKGKGEEQNKEKDKITKYLSDNIKLIEQTNIIVFVENDVDKFSLFKTIDKLGIVCNFEHQNVLQVQKRLMMICKAYKVNIDSETVKYFIESCGIDMQLLINEMRKLIEYAGEGGTISKKDVDNLCIKQMESVIFDLTDNLGKKNVTVAMEVLNNLIYSKEPIQKILITLYNHFRKVYLTQIAIDNNKDILLSLELKPNQAFLVNKYKNQAKCFRKDELEKIIDELIDLDYKYKIGLIDVNVGLESIICSIE